MEKCFNKVDILKYLKTLNQIIFTEYLMLSQLVWESNISGFHVQGEDRRGAIVLRLLQSSTKNLLQKT